VSNRTKGPGAEGTERDRGAGGDRGGPGGTEGGKAGNREDTGGPSGTDRPTDRRSQHKLKGHA